MVVGRAEQEKVMEKTKLADLLNALKYLDEIPTLYDNTYPNNCLGGKWQNNYFFKTGDCWNGAVKAMLWTNTKGAYDKEDGSAHYLPNSDLGDWTGTQILAHCYDRSTDMSNIQPGEFLYLVYNGGSHAGVYYGEVNGKRKVGEFTPIWEDGFHLSDIADDGTRSYMGVKCAKWQEHGKMPWVEYPIAAQPITPPTEDITEIEVDGDADEKLPLWKKLTIDILFAIAKAINETFGSKE